MVSLDPVTVGQYRRGEIIGRGNFGVVYKGVDTKSKRVVAIKTLDLDAGVDEVESVQHEVNLLQRLSSAESSNVTKYYGSMMVGSKLWIIMDLCSGGSVRTLLKGGPLDDKCLSIIFRETTTAVGAIHREGIIHRDIKAANVLITMSGQVKLCDFGVAAELSLSNKAKRTTIVGTPYWMAPEVITEGRSYDTKADIWSLGVTLYEMVTGNPPYSEYEAMRALMLISKSRPPRLEGPKYAPILKDIIAVCLDEVPDARPTADELLKHKFVKQYVKTSTTVLRSVVMRYLDWKQRNANHRDSLLMFNPNPSLVEDEFDSGDDDQSVWDFKPDAPEANDNLQVGVDDMSEAPDTLREVFGLPPKPQEEYINQLAPPPILRRAMTEVPAPSPPTSVRELQHHQQLPHRRAGPTDQQFVFPQAQIHQSGPSPTPHAPQPMLQYTSQSAAVQPPTGQATPVQSAAIQSASAVQLASANHPPSAAVSAAPGIGPGSEPATPHVPTSHPSYTAIAQAQGEAIAALKQSHSSAQQQQGHQRPVANLQRVPTAVSASFRNRSTTVSASMRDPARAIWRGRHASEVTESSQALSLAASQAAQDPPPALQQLQGQPHAPAQAPVYGDQEPHQEQGYFKIQGHYAGQSAQGGTPGEPLHAGQQEPQAQAFPQLPRIPKMTSLETDIARAADPPSPRSHEAVERAASTANEAAPAAGTPDAAPRSKVPSPKRAVQASQPHEAATSAREMLPRLVMPSRTGNRPPPLLSAPPTGSAKLHIPTLPNIRRRTNPWVNEFPPMPKVNTNILLNSTPDNLASEQLLELLMGFKTAITSLAGQLEGLETASAR